MNDVLLMGRIDRIGNLSGYAERLGHRQWAVLQPLRKRWPFDELQNQRAQFRRLFQSVNGADVRMVERRQQACFSGEAGAALGIRPGTAAEAS